MAGKRSLETLAIIAVGVFIYAVDPKVSEAGDEKV